ncbi:MAG: hypothetical protein Ct9H90mP27_3570 [Gammaproteobacteria bacterium]|nr:MAG: hypothetical protein Ct9H90mP27_3570 [Gammaproteobacteria bacterium]
MKPVLTPRYSNRTSHGAYKFSRPPSGDVLAIDRIKEIHSRLPNTHLVMHGSSSVPQDLLSEIKSLEVTPRENPMVCP